MEEKIKLRKKIKYILATTPSNYFVMSSKKIFTKTKSLLKKLKSKKICVYVSLKEEVDTSQLIPYLLENGYEVAVPRCQEAPNMELVKIESLDELIPGAYGILEPLQSNKIINAKDIEAFVVPCISVSSKGLRIGHGKGYYDNILKNYHGKKICLCYSKCMLETIPQEKQDIKMDYIINEDEIIIASPVDSIKNN